MGVDFSAFSEIPVPDEAGVDDVPYWLTQLVGQIDQRLIVRALSTSDRDSKFYLMDMGAICVIVDTTPSVQGVYVKTSAPGSSAWGTVWKAPAAIAWTDLALASDMTQLSSKPQISLDDSGRWGTLKGDIQTISTATLANGTTVATIPSQFILPETVKLTVAINQVPTYWGSGYLVLDAATNNINTWGITGAAQPQWVGLWSARFQCHQ